MFSFLCLPKAVILVLVKLAQLGHRREKRETIKIRKCTLATAMLGKRKVSTHVI